MAERQISMDELLDAQKKLADKAMKLNDMNDGDEIAKEAKKLQKEAEDLEAMAKTFEKQQEDHWAAERERLGVTKDGAPRKVKVQLTDDQRKQILEEEGVRIEVVELDEGVDVREKSMPEEHPEVILELARKKAQRKKDRSKVDEEARQRAQAALAELEAQKDNKDLQRLLAEKKKDPEFMKTLGLESE